MHGYKKIIKSPFIFVLAMPHTNENIEIVDLEKLETDLDSGWSLVLWNDDVNTFEHVIQALIEICNHTEQQAEQCAMIIHNKGKYAVEKGSYESLKPKCEAFCDRLINATLE